jgi:cytochrome c
MKYALLTATLLLFVLASCKKETTEQRVLVFSKTNGFRHESIGPGKLALMELGRQHNFVVDTTEDASHFNEDNLKRYKAVVFLNTTQNVLNELQQADFKRFIEAGGGFVGIHAAADTEYEWHWYGKLVGAYFKSHPQIQEAKLKKVRAFGPNTLPDEWVVTDEWYNFKSISKDIKVIYNLDESSYKGGENGENHPIAWYHEFAGGRSFYTGLGHTNESYADPKFLNHVLQGIQYAMGDDVELDYDEVRTQRAIEENRFTKTVLDFNLNEPTEMTVLPSGKILFIERKGDVKLYDPSIGKVSVINTIKTWTKFEDGLIGLTADPDFSKNNFVYIFYSHPERSANVLSRFLFKENKLDLSSEKEILEVPTQRDKCCHTGGSLQFGADRMLFVSTGDNTSPFESDGFSPSDEQPAREAFDAQKSSSNTNDLRGKILRIILREDGTYDIPEGNLFPPGEEKTRPEIYVMGNRNPYRISVDSKTGFLYWGEVGPDAGTDDPQRGPRGYDEINQAREAGFFGWPYFVGDNYAYSRYDFSRKRSLKKWNPEKPVNESPNNTGKRELPPAKPAFIWYPYEKSDEFPMVKEGGRNAMAGPVYYSEDYKGTKTAFPAYFDGKLLAYDWMRNWMFLVTMDDQGDIYDLDPFMPNTKFNNVIDMAYGPDGRLYMLEYGTAWFKQNMDARLVRIDYNGGNRPPVVQLAADKLSGAVPLEVNFTAKGTVDYDNDKLDYLFEVADTKQTSPGGNFTYTFDKPGIYNVTLTARDSKDASGKSQVKIIAGNETPQVTIEVTEGNKTFFFPGTPLSYQVSVTDREDGTSESGAISNEDVKVTFDYLKGFDITSMAQGHQKAAVEMPGKRLIDQSDCKSCHLIDQKSAGPSYKDVALRYKGEQDAVNRLAEKIIKGGSGAWGTIEMAAHPQITVDDARKMVDYILTLDNAEDIKLLPLKGTATPGKELDGAYLINASYVDKGAGEIPSLSAANTLVLRAAFLRPDHASELRDARVINANGQVALENVKHNGFAAFRQIDLTGIRSATVSGFIRDEEQVGGKVELRLDSPDGKLWGSAELKGRGLREENIRLTAETGMRDVYVIFSNSEAGDKTLYYFGGVRFRN